MARPLKSIRAGLSRWRHRRHNRRVKLDQAQQKIGALKQELADAKLTRTIPMRALTEAARLTGVMEVGGNNRGPMVEKIITYAQGAIGEPWCVDFVIWCYGHAGSQVFKPGAPRAVRFMNIPGTRKTTTPHAGDIVRYTFDHTGLFVCDNRDGTITTIEGNTGRAGAVSDSRTGGDGVYRKVRAKSLVADYLEVAR